MGALPEASPAAARAGVLVSAPAKVPAMRGTSMPRALPTYRPPIAATAYSATIVRIGPIAVLRLWKKEAPELIPMAKVNRVRPRVPSWGVTRSSTP